MKRVKYDPKLPTIQGGKRMMKRLTQTELDDRIRAAARPATVEEIVNETPTKQMYQLSDGRLLTVWKATGKVQVGDTTNR